MRASFFILRGQAHRRAVYAFRQRGISLMMVLICLLLMSLAAVGLVRMVDTGTLVVGNVAFKQATTSVSDSAAEAGINWLILASGSETQLDSDSAASGYYATSLNELDASGNDVTRATRVLVDWNGDNCAYAGQSPFANCITPAQSPPVDGYTVQYIITRMCRQAGPPSATSNECTRPIAQSSSPSDARGGLSYGNHERFETKPPGPFYRIVVRSVGPRNTISITETYVYL